MTSGCMGSRKLPAQVRRSRMRLAGLSQESELPIVVSIRVRRQRAGSEGAALVLMRAEARKDARMTALCR